MEYRNYYGDIEFSVANQQLLLWYGKGYHFLNDTMLLDMIQTQEKIKPCLSLKWYSDLKIG